MNIYYLKSLSGVITHTTCNRSHQRHQPGRGPLHLPGHRLQHLRAAGEEGPPSYIWGAIRDLKVHRVDHGVRCLEDEALVDYLVQHQIPLTVCPLSNLKLAVVNDLRKHPLRAMLEAGLAASIHSDDPAYFGGYITENYNATAVALNLSAEEVVQLARNAVQGSFLEDDRRQALLAKIQTCYEKHKHDE